MTILPLQKQLRSRRDKQRAASLQRFFKTGPGDYGEGDLFLGLTVPQCRACARDYKKLPLADIQKVLASQYHEERLVALFILVEQFRVGTLAEQKKIFDCYIANIRYVNNWDLVDTTCHKVVGEYLYAHPADQKILTKLARSRSLWEKRIAIIATFAFIRHNDFKPSMAMVRTLRNDSHDLIHKAVGWTLREVGKKSLSTEKIFLQKYYKTMPRTALRYAIEKFPPAERKRYLAGAV